MLSHIRRWWHLCRTARPAADATVVVILLPHPAAHEPGRQDHHGRIGPDEQRARAVLLTVLGEHPAPGGDLR